MEMGPKHDGPVRPPHRQEPTMITIFARCCLHPLKRRADGLGGTR